MAAGETHGHADGVAQLALMLAAGAPVQIGVAEVLALHVRDQIVSACVPSTIEVVQLDRAQPGAQQLARVRGSQIAARRPVAGVALAQQPTHHRHHPRRVGVSRALVRRAWPERACGERDRGVCPLGGASLGAVRAHLAATHVCEELLGGARGRRLGVGAPDVDARVVVAAADADPVACGDVRGSGAVELASARPVARLPHGEQLRQAPAVTRAERSGDGVVGMRERARDVALAQVVRAQLDVVAVSLEPLVVLAGDAVAEDVDRLWLAAEARGQLLGDEHVGPVGDLEHARDRVVVGDRHEVHAAALGQLVDLLRRRRALRQADRALHAELGDLRCARVAVHVHPADRLGGCLRAGVAVLRRVWSEPRGCRSVTIHISQFSLQSPTFCDQAATIV